MIKTPMSPTSALDFGDRNTAYPLYAMRFRQIKKFYQYVNTLMRREFPRLPSYGQFIELIPQCNVFLMHFLILLKDHAQEFQSLIPLRWPLAIIFVSVALIRLY